MGLVVHESVEPAQVGIAFVGGETRAVDDDEAQADLTVGPGVNGSFVMMRFRPGHAPFGERLAPYAVSALDLAATMWGFELPHLTAAPDAFAR
jgi:hypothetical protein